MNASEEVKKESEINQALEEQEIQIEYFSDLVERAFVRFSSVLRSEPATQALDEKSDVESSVPLVNTIKGKTRRIRNSNSKLNNLSKLCEL